MSAHLKFSSLCLLLFLCSGAIKFCVAIHEDEQGSKEWVRRFAGDVRYATIPVNSKSSMLYVASSEGAISALDLTSFSTHNLTWRQFFSDPPACISSTKDVVVAATLNGSVFQLNAENGFLEMTFSLEFPPTLKTASHAACFAAGDNVTVVLYGFGVAAVYEFDINRDEEKISVARIMDLGKNIKQLRLPSAHRLWVLTPDRALQYDINSNYEVLLAQGNELFPASTGEFVIHSPQGFTLRNRQGGIQRNQTCSKCRAAILTNLDDGSFVGITWVSVGPTNALRVHFPSTEVQLDVLPSAGQVELLLAFRKDSLDYTLIRSGSGHLYLVQSSEGLVWERPEGLSCASATIITDPIGPLDHFHFNKQLLIVSRFGVLYRIPVLEKGKIVDVVTDFSGLLVAKLNVTNMEDVHIEHLSAPNATNALIYCRYHSKTALLSVNIERKEINGVMLFDDVLVMSPQYTITKDMKLHGHLELPELHLHVVHATSGLVNGYLFSNQSSTAVPTWSLKFPSSIIAYTSGTDPSRTTFVNQLYVYPNFTEDGLVEEVRHRYPMRNVIAVARYEHVPDKLPILVVTAIDAITGTVLATTRQAGVQGKVNIIVVEHAVIYHYLDAHKMRYCFGVWELFQDEKGDLITKDSVVTIPQIIASFFVKQHRVHSSRASQPPSVVVTNLGVFGGPLADMGVTVSQHSIARKSLVLAFETGRVALVELRQLLSGGQMPMPNKKDERASHVLIFSQLLATHKYRLTLPQRIITAPTNLESSCHVLVTGLDIFYVQSSSGKPFDLLNSDYNKPFLLMLVIGIMALSFVARYFVMRKNVSGMWT